LFPLTLKDVLGHPVIQRILCISRRSCCRYSGL
jgi:hypothetical protein